MDGWTVIMFSARNIFAVCYGLCQKIGGQRPISKIIPFVPKKLVTRLLPPKITVQIFIRQKTYRHQPTQEL